MEQLLGKTGEMEACTLCPYKDQHCQDGDFILTRVAVMCWLLVIFTALLCSEVSRAHPNLSQRRSSFGGGAGGSGNDAGGGGGTAAQVDADGAKVQKELKEAMKELELAERLAEEANSRESRGLLKKVAFLAGMRVGGLVQSSGTLAASNSLRVFGKVVNSALSVSYGTIDELNELPGIENNPGEHVLEPAAVKVISVEEKPVPQSVRETEDEAHRRIKTNFLATHNEHVERANAKFLRNSRANDFSGPTETK